MKYIIAMLMLGTTLLANSITLKYDLDVSLFGTVGYADIIYTEGDGHYRMEARARAVGSVASLTGNYTETYISEGTVRKGKFIPEVFVKIKRTDSEFNEERYLFDHVHKTVTETHHKELKVSTHRFDVVSMRIKNDISTEISDDTKVMKRYAADDPLSTFLNARSVLKGERSDVLIDAIAIKSEDTAIISKLLQNTLQLTLKDF
jgi:hypothetical protein